MSLRSVPRAATLALCAAALAVAQPLHAAEEAVNAVSRHVESLDVAPGSEHRLVVVHPVLGRIPDGAAPKRIRLGGSLGPDELAFGRMAVAVRNRVEAASFVGDPVLVVAGDVLRTPTADFVATGDVLLQPGEPLEVPVERISKEVHADSKSVETTTLGQALPSALRWLVANRIPGPGLRAESERWVESVRLETPRRSPAELGLAAGIAKRAADYRKEFAALQVPAMAPGREIVGYALVLDGDFAALETFGTGVEFAAAWPRVLEGIAAEAAVRESVTGLLDADLADPADPDRFLADLKKRMLGLFGARPVVRDVREGARRYEIEFENTVTRAIVVGDAKSPGGSRVAHMALIVDPERREQRTSDEGFDPIAASRKARPTEEEKRLLERRKGGQPLPQPVPPPAPPPAPEQR